jgi:hypothetical protein
MRSGLVAALMGVGGIFTAFGVTVLIITIFSRMNHWLQVPTEMSVGTLTVVIGGAMIVAGYLLNRIGRRSNDTAAI